VKLFVVAGGDHSLNGAYLEDENTRFKAVDKYCSEYILNMERDVEITDFELNSIVNIPTADGSYVIDYKNPVTLYNIGEYRY